VPSIPIHYDLIQVSNGVRGAGRRTVGRVVAHTAFRDAAYDEASSYDIKIANETGIDVGDVSAFRAVCLQWGVVIIVRCPGRGAGRAARLGLGVVPKPEDLKEAKIGDDIVAVKNLLIVADYDLMGVWEADGDGTYRRIPFTRRGKGEAARWTDPRAAALFARLNAELVLPLQHGANDDWNTGGRQELTDIKYRAVLGHARFVAFTETGAYRPIPNPGALEQFYREHGVPWPYGR
jgi:hypothetical protein